MPRRAETSIYARVLGAGRVWLAEVDVVITPKKGQIYTRTFSGTAIRNPEDKHKDVVGSELALGRALENAGKRLQKVAWGGVEPKIKLHDTTHVLHSHPGEIVPQTIGTERYVTKTGKVLTDSDFEQLADEAEEGYNVTELKDREIDIPLQSKTPRFPTEIRGPFSKKLVRRAMRHAKIYYGDSHKLTEEETQSWIQKEARYEQAKRLVKQERHEAKKARREVVKHRGG